ncbi:Fic/DOC family N-terminal domain-containing protein, partial [Corynebacterium striatum]|uniref:Fic/DOC family N-terminal domain-containing protein n=1 Tax=Corynebacterium striatum TaxID=43770 RepID=UPI003B5A1C1D
MEFSPELTSRAARIEREILDLNRHAASGQLESVARLLMRSEAISSSRIEGIAPNVDKVVLAELAQKEEVRSFKESAEEVARNLTVLCSIEKSFATEPTSPSCQMRVLGTGVPETRYCRVPGSWYRGRADGVGPAVCFIRPVLL